jgi:hypothetical protein
MKYLVSVSFASFLLVLYFCSISDSSYISDTFASICSAFASSSSVLLLFSIVLSLTHGCAAITWFMLPPRHAGKQ